MKRREAIKSYVVIAGALSTVSISTILSSCKAEATTGWKPEFFSLEEINLLKSLTECIIPKTDTPGANDALVHQFIDSAVNDVLEKKEQDIFRTGLQRIQEKSQSAHQKSFVDLAINEQNGILEYFHKDAEAKIKADSKAKEIFPLLKQLTVAGFFTSEIGSTQVLRHNPIPGEFLGCVPFGDDDVMMAQAGGAY